MASRAQYTGTVRDNFTGITLAFISNVANGSLAVIRVSKWGGGGSDPFVIGDISKSSGTATIGTITLDKQFEYNITGVYYLNTAIYSVPVTGAGSLEFTIGGAASGSYLSMALEELTGDIDVSSTRVAGTNSGSGASGAPDGGNVTVTGGGVICGALCTNGSASTAHTQDAAFTLLYESEDGVNHNTASYISRISASSLTDNPSWTAPTTLEWVAVAVAYKIVVSGHTVAVGQVTESDTAQAIAHRKVKSIGQPSETDLSQPVAHRKTKTIGQISETDLAQAITHRKTKTIGQPSETDLSRPVTRLITTITVSVLQVAESDTAQAVTHRKSKTIVQATESDTAQAIAHRKVKAIGQTSETDLSQAVTHRKIKLIALVTETDLAQAITHRKSKTIGQPSEADISQPVAHSKRKAISQAQETDSAQALTHLTGIIVNQVEETDLARALFPGKRLAIVQTFEIDLAQPLSRHKIISIGQASETDIAQVVLAAGIVNIRVVSIDSMAMESVSVPSVVQDVYTVNSEDVP